MGEEARCRVRKLSAAGLWRQNINPKRMDVEWKT